MTDVAALIRERAGEKVPAGPWSFGPRYGALVSQHVTCSSRGYDCHTYDTDGRLRALGPGDVCAEVEGYGGHLLCESLMRTVGLHLSAWTPEFARAVADLLDAVAFGEAPDVAAERVRAVFLSQSNEVPT